MTQPQVSVGIVSNDSSISFNLSGIYSGQGTDVITGSQEATISDSGMAVSWNGKLYPFIEFTPTSYDGDTFTLKDVTIGVNFHWERREDQRFRGSLRIIADNGRLTAINIIGVEDYLTSVISSEMSSTSSLPLLRAHAVISRSWLLAQMEHKSEKRTRQRPHAGELVKWWDHEDHQLFDVCADDHCQRYQGTGRILSDNAISAVGSTRGEVLMYAGKLCDTRFSKCCGGVMEVFRSCWDDEDIPYLAPGRDAPDTQDFPDLTNDDEADRWINGSPSAFCNTTDARILSQVLNSYDRERPDFYRWTEEYTQERIRSLISKRIGTDMGDIIDLEPMERGTSGRIVRLRIRGSLGEIVIGKELMIRRVLSENHLRSSAFTVEKADLSSGGVPGRFILHGAGWGHGVGLCQIGAAVMGDKGYGYEAILSHYYPGSEIIKIY